MLPKKITNARLESAFFQRDNAISYLLSALQKIFDTCIMFRSSSEKNAHVFF